MASYLPDSYFAQSVFDRALVAKTEQQIARRKRVIYKLPGVDYRGSTLAEGTFLSGEPVPALPPAPSSAVNCQYGGPCCGLTGVRCRIPGLPCGGCTAEQAEKARAALGI
jgi:hypothetical protein